MDDLGFDLLSRRVGSVISRRTGLGALAAGAIALLAPGTTGETSAARQCVQDGKRCGPGAARPCSRCCSGHSERVGQARKGKPRRRKCTGDDGLQAPTPCIPAGQDGCAEPADCCTGTSCRRDGVCRAGACAEGGAPCPNGVADCCSDAICTEAGVCCSVLGGACTANANCCDDHVCTGSNTCEATCVDGRLASCSSTDCCVGRTCQGNPMELHTPRQCCVRDGEVCVPGPAGANPPGWNGFCCEAGSGCAQHGLCGPCGFDGEGCSTTDDCCQGYSCIEGECQYIAE